MLTRQKFLMIFCAFVFFIAKANAQGSSHKGWYGLLQQGVVFNNSEVKIQPGMATGYQWKGYGLGLNVGIDFLQVRSIQPGIDLRKTIKIGRQHVVLFASPGVNYNIPTKEEKAEASRFRLDQQFKNGHYLDAGAGILMGKKKNLLAGVYWSRKTYKETFTNFLWNPVLQKMEELPATTIYEYNRLGIKVGFLF